MSIGTVQKFATEVVLPKVQSMDGPGEMDREVIKGLFENGVRWQPCSLDTPATGHLRLLCGSPE